MTFKDGIPVKLPSGDSMHVQSNMDGFIKFK